MNIGIDVDGVLTDLEKFQLENGRILQTVETNPYTEVYKIIEEIQKN